MPGSRTCGLSARLSLWEGAIRNNAAVPADARDRATSTYRSVRPASKPLRICAISAWQRESRRKRKGRNMPNRIDRDLEVELHDVFHVQQVSRDTPIEEAVGADLVTMESGQSSQTHRHNFSEKIGRAHV